MAFSMATINNMLSVFNKMRWRRSTWGWIFYDWANSAFATVVIAGFFPIFFRDYWAVGLDDAEVTLILGIANSSSGILLMLAAPVIGFVADNYSVKKPALILCAAIGALSTIAFVLVGEGHWLVAIVCYTLAVFMFMAGNVFYDALLMDVSRPADYNQVSAAGFALGYLGGGLVLAASVLAVWQGGAEKILSGFVAVGIWWLVFTIPLMLWVRERRKQTSKAVSFTAPLRLFRKQPAVAWFLVAYWLYIDAVDTVIRMAVNYGQVIGFQVKELIFALLLVQLIGFPATILYGHLADYLGTRAMIIVGVVAYIIICIVGASLESIAGFYFLVVLIALVQGGLQAQSRSFYARLVPAEHAAQFFGIYNMLGKFAVVFGPLLMSGIGYLSDSPRVGLLSLTILLVLSLIILISRVPPQASSGQSNTIGLDKAHPSKKQ